jgi:hypothetical protein
MPLEDLFNFALNIKEAGVNPKMDAKDNKKTAKIQRPKPQFLESRGGRKR